MTENNLKGVQMEALSLKVSYMISDEVHTCHYGTAHLCVILDAPFPTRYTYGQSGQGKAQIRVCREFSSSGYCESDNNEICEQFTAQVQAPGLLQRDIPTTFS